MQLVILDQDASREFDAEVKVLAPGADEPSVFTARFLELPQSQLAELLAHTEAPAQRVSRKLMRRETDRTNTLLKKILKSLSGILDSDGKEIPWGEGLLNAVQQRVYIRDALIRTYTDHITGARELGN